MQTSPHPPNNNIMKGDMVKSITLAGLKNVRPIPWYKVKTSYA